MHHDGAAEEVAECVHPPPQLEEQVGVLGHPVVRPAGELNVSHLPSSRFLFFLVKRSNVLYFSPKQLPDINKRKGRPVQITPHAHFFSRGYIFSDE